MAVLEALECIALSNLAEKEVGVDGDIEAAHLLDIIHIECFFTLSIRLKILFKLNVHGISEFLLL